MLEILRTQFLRKLGTSASHQEASSNLEGMFDKILVSRKLINLLFLSILTRYFNCNSIRTWTLSKHPRTAHIKLSINNLPNTFWNCIEDSKICCLVILIREIFFTPPSQRSGYLWWCRVVNIIFCVPFASLYLFNKYLNENYIMHLQRSSGSTESEVLNITDLCKRRFHLKPST